jgi:hypothetical protein
MQLNALEFLHNLLNQRPQQIVLHSVKKRQLKNALVLLPSSEQPRACSRHKMLYCKQMQKHAENILQQLLAYDSMQHMQLTPSNASHV